MDLFNKCLRESPKTVIEPPRIEGARLAPVEAYPAFMNGYPVWIVRPQITVYKRDVAELVADARLRDLFGLKDGDKVEIELRDP